MTNTDYIIKILFSLLIGALIGYDREQSDKQAGLRTIMLISLGTTTFAIIPFMLLSLSKEYAFNYDFSRVLSYIIGGVGFLSGVVIINNKTKKCQVEGITTSACLWSTVASSMLIGIGQYTLGSIIGICIWLILKLKYIKKYIK